MKPAFRMVLAHPSNWEEKNTMPYTRFFLMIFFVSIILIGESAGQWDQTSEPNLDHIQSFAGDEERAWTWKYPVPQGNTIRAVRFSQSTGIAVGDYGTIICTKDSGLSWNFVANSFTQHLQGLCHLPENKWLVVGREGLILMSTDDGLTWNHVQLDNGADLFAVDFASAEIGAVVGSDGTILWSNDGGISWILKSSGINSDLRAIDLLTVNKAVAVGKDGVILKTIDSGESWDQKDGDMDLFAVEFIDENNGFAAGGDIGYLKNSRTILRTLDGGDSWQPQHEERGSILYGITLMDSQNILACGEEGTLLHSTDGGTKWASQESPTDRTLSSLAFMGNSGVAFGSYGATASTVDGGKTWTSQSPEEEKSLSSVNFADPKHGLVAGDENMLLWTSDSGNTWSSSKTLPGRYIWSGCLLNPQTAIGLGDGGVIFRTEDAGGTWKQISTGIDYGLRKMNFVDENVGIAIGYSVIITTEDGGKIWTRRSIPQHIGDCSLIDIAYVDKTRWLVVGSQGVILASEDGGQTWTVQSSPVKKILYGVAWSDSQTATIVGEKGLILQYVEETGWTERKSGTSYRLYAVEYTSPLIGYVIGQFGTILRTDDGGRTWNPENSHTYNHLYNLTCVGAEVFVTGWNSTILHRQFENLKGGKE